MKKLSLILLAMMFSGLISAQTLIPKVGASISTLALSDDTNLFGVDPNFKFGFLIGAGYEIAISDAFAVQPELLFIQKGAGFKEGGDKASINLNYLELPVMAKYKFSNFYVNAGPYIAYGLGGKLKYQADGEPEVSVDIKFGEEPNNNQDDFYFDNALDFGIQVGGGVVIIEKIVVDVRFGMGFGNLFDEPDGFTGDIQSQNRAIQVSVGYPISFK